MSQQPYLKNFLKVRLVTNFEQAKDYYENVLGFQVDGWGHTEIGSNLGFILQQARNPEDVRPNAVAGNRAYPNNWSGPECGWDSYFYSDFDGVGQLYDQFKSNGAIIAYEPQIEQMGDSQWKEFAVKDLDGYVIVFGGGN